MGMPQRTHTAGASAAAVEHRHLEALVEGQGRVLEIIRADALADILVMIARWVEAQSESGLVASLHLLDPEGRHLLRGAAPSLPDAYNDAIHGLAIGPRPAPAAPPHTPKKLSSWKTSRMIRSGWIPRSRPAAWVAGVLVNAADRQRWRGIGHVRDVLPPSAATH